MRYVLAILMLFFVFVGNAFAVSDPRNNVNNKVGIGVLSPESDLEDAASMVNSGGEWGWTLIVVKKSEMDVDRWQRVLNDMNRLKLIPIIRIATNFNEEGVWQKPDEKDAKAWADFLSKLYFPTKNKYVQIYNEVNHSGEWGGTVNPAEYANELDKTITALKSKSEDFFVLSSPLDLATPTTSRSMDAGVFFVQMEVAKPGIFKRLDGWASHSYPNPGFSANPLKSGRTGIDGYKWELDEVKSYLGGKDLPVFITETGWDKSKVDPEQVAVNFDVAFKSVWSDERVVAITPFVFDYPDSLFHSFSFKTTGDVLGEKFYPQYQKIKNMPKVRGEPLRADSAQVVSSYMPLFVIKDTKYSGRIVLKNVGNYIWNSENLNVNSLSDDVHIDSIKWSSSELYPGQTVTGEFMFEANSGGDLNVGPVIKNQINFLADLKATIVSETYSQRALRLWLQIFD